MLTEDTKETLADRRRIEALAGGDQRALVEVFDAYGERIFRFSYRMLGDRTEAEDVTAETFLRMMRRASDVRANGAFRTWLFRIARNLCVDRLRQQRLVELPPETAVGGTEERATLRVTVQQALAELPAEYREPLVLCDVEELPAREAAEVLKISVPALKSRLYRGRRALRDKLAAGDPTFASS